MKSFWKIYLFFQSAISESAIIRSLEAKTQTLHDRLELDLLNEIEKFRIECLQHYSDSTDNEERLLERIRNLEKELYESNDNHQFEMNNAKSMIQELQEKLEYDCRRMNREFSEKLDNVYECIEKLELGREKKLGKLELLKLLYQILEAEKKMADSESAESLKELLVNLLLGLFAIVLFVIKTVQVSINQFFSQKSSISARYPAVYSFNFANIYVNWRTTAEYYFLEFILNFPPLSVSSKNNDLFTCLLCLKVFKPMLVPKAL